MTLDRPGVSPAAKLVAYTLRVDHTTAEVLRAFASAHVSCILLKGPSTARWLYDDGEPRTYADSDLLLRPGDARAAARVLSEMGFVSDLVEGMPAPWWSEHAVPWVDPVHGRVVDLHGTIPGVGVDSERLWSTLSRHTDTLTVGGFQATVLAPPGLASSIALHAAQHSAEWAAALVELERALARAGEDTWRAAAALATELEATGAFGAGLRRLPDGRTLAARLELPHQVPVDTALVGDNAPNAAFAIERLARASGVRERLRIIRYKVAPPPEWVRRWLPPERQARRHVMQAYVLRVTWLLTRVPGAVIAWRRARRAGRAD
jgi:hypothetical protein